ncbi:MAG TPA: hypothetical protein PKV01_09590, partial [Anaerolineales bacterium]|nr:hypothetical protein [Anaerolineales bacterium]
CSNLIRFSNCSLRNISYLDQYNSGVYIPLFTGEIPEQSYNPFIRPLNGLQGGGDYKNGLLQSLVDEGKEAVITPETEKIIYYGTFN